VWYRGTLLNSVYGGMLQSPLLPVAIASLAVNHKQAGVGIKATLLQASAHISLFWSRSKDNAAPGSS
jgi:hypothetical protein